MERVTLQQNAERSLAPRVSAGVPAGDGHDLADLFDVLRRHALLIAVATLSGALLSLALVRALPHEYRAEAKLVLERENGNLFEVIPEAAGLALDRQAIETELQFINSRVLAEAVVERLDLASDPYFGGVPTPQEEASEPRSAIWNGLLSAIGLSPDDRAGGPAAVVSSDPAPVGAPPSTDAPLSTDVPLSTDAPSAASGPDQTIDDLAAAERRKRHERAVTAFRSRIEASRFGQSLALSIVATHVDPVEAAQLANTVAETYITERVRQRREATMRAMEFLTGRAADLGLAIAMLEQRIVEHRFRHALDGPDQHAELRARIGYLESRTALGDAAPEDVDDGATVSGDALRDELARARDELRDVSRAEVDLQRMERDLASLRTRNDQVTARLDNLNLQAEPLNIPARVITPAQVPLTPFSPKGVLIVTGGTLAALLLAAMLVLVLEAADRRPRRGREVEAITGLPNLGYIPETSSRWWRVWRSPHETIQRDPHAAFADAMRDLDALARFPRHGVPSSSRGKVLAITSPRSGEGKTTLTISLAITASLAGSRTVLLDLDPYGRGASRTLDDREEDGGATLEDVLAGRCEIEDALVRQDEFAGFDVLGFGRTPDSPPLGDALPRLLASLRERFDAIIVDLPPVLAPAGVPRSLRHADAALLLVQWGRSDRRSLETAMERLGAARAKFLGTLLTRVAWRERGQGVYGAMPAAGYRTGGTRRMRVGRGA